MLEKAEIGKILDFQTALEGERKQYESLWRDVATFIDPNADDFGAESERKQGQKKGERVFDNTAIMARDRLAAAHESMLTPRQAKWHGLKSTEPSLNEIEEVQEYFEAVVHRLFAARYSPKANFSAQIGAYYQCLDTFGTGAVFVDENIGKSLRYKALNLNELYFAEDFQGRVTTVHRKFVLTATAAVGALKAGRFEQLPKRIINAANDPARKLERSWFLHCVYENDEGGYEGGNSYPYESHYVAVEDQFHCAEGGYRSMPYAVGRYATGPRETYGRAPGMTVLRDIQMLSEMNKTAIREAQRLADPPMFLSGTPGNTAFSMRAGSVNWGMVDPVSGKPLAQPLQTNADLSALLELIQDRRQSINDAFLVTLFQILLEKPPNMTATEALLRAQEKGVLLAPSMGRQQSEFLGPMIEREIDILTEAGEFDDLPMPDVLRGAGVEIIYDAPLNRLMKTDDAVGILRTIEALTAPAEITQGKVYNVFKWDKVARTLADANGAPPSVLNSLEEMAEIEKQDQTNQALEQTAQVAPAIGKTVKDLAQAQAAGQNNPPAIPFVQPA